VFAGLREWFRTWSSRETRQRRKVERRQEWQKARRESDARRDQAFPSFWNRTKGK
jgi:hypothetical protein